MAEDSPTGPRQLNPKLAAYQRFVVDGLAGKIALDGNHALIWILDDWIKNNPETLGSARLTFADFMQLPKPPNGPRPLGDYDAQKRRNRKEKPPNPQTGSNDAKGGGA
jgi:hypothetical protein